MSERIRLGFVPLIDAALPIIAHELEFARQQGVDLQLVKEASWATVRDKLRAGHLDAAHFLAPAAIAMSRGIGQRASPLAAPMLLGLNGNAIILAPWLKNRMLDVATSDAAEPRVTAAALISIADKRRATGERPLRLAVVYPHSTHTYLLHHWIRLADANALAKLQFPVVPPPFMCANLEHGAIDGFCVGAPWWAMAVAAGHGDILHLGIDLIRDCPDKLLVLPEALAADSGPAVPLTAALIAAAYWCELPANWPEMAQILAQEKYLGVAQRFIDDILAGNIRVDRAGSTRCVIDAIRLSPDALCPAPAFETTISNWMAASGEDMGGNSCLPARQTTLRPDIFGSAACRAKPFQDCD